MKKYLIVGLGNKGEKYVHTRHNIGFLVAEAIVEKLETSFETTSFGWLAKGKYKGKQVLVLKPDTYMNLSGKAIIHWMKKENIAKENLLVITDDLNLNIGTIRIKAKGSDGGHNGLKSIQDTLQTNQYPRLRFGIGSEFEKGRQVDYVLGEWDEEEQKILPERIDKMATASLSFCFAGLANTMNEFNGK